MTAKVLVDTNVLVYVYDRSEPVKQQRALETLDSLLSAGIGVVSTQVLAEFFVAVTRRLTAPLTVVEAYTRLENLLQVWPVVAMSDLTVLEAARGVRDYQMSFWDAQIWAAARLNQITIILSEDFNPGAVMEGVRFINPFAPDFIVADWLE
ncbi:MAG: PIN domain-containing protein [Chloroflexi bacterium]|nr:PIN domain-containing protein [Chloroflexota bacterium]